MNALGTVVRTGRPKNQPRPKIDKGTLESQAHRAELVGRGDSTYASYPLGVLLERGIIDRDMHDAGQRYERHAARVLRVPPMGVCETAAPDDPDGAKAEAHWRACVNALLAVGRRAKDAVDNAVIFHRMPSWLFRSHVRSGDEHERESLRAGLAALVRLHNGA